MKFTEEEKLYIVQFVSKGSSARTEERLDFLKTPISVAAKHWNKSSSRKLLRIGNRICSDHYRGSNPCSVLYRAIETGDADYVGLILSVRGDVAYLCDKQGETPLHYAARKGSPDVIRILLGHGSDIIAHSRCGDIPICLAIQSGHFPAVEVLLEVAASRDPPVSYFNVKAPRSVMALAVGHHPDILRALIEHCKKSHHAVPTGELMPDVVASGKAGAVEALLEAGADIEGPCFQQDGSRPLHLAAQQAYCDVMNTLLQHGAKVDSKDNMGRTPLHRVVSGTAGVDKAVQAIAILAAGGADGTAKDVNGKTAVEQADQTLKTAMEPILAQARAEHSWQQKLAVVQWKKRLGRKLENEGLYSLMTRLAGLEEEGIFRKVLGFL